MLMPRQGTELHITYVSIEIFQLSPNIHTLSVPPDIVSSSFLILYFIQRNNLFVEETAKPQWLTARTPDPEVGGSSPTRVAVLCP